MTYIRQAGGRPVGGSNALAPIERPFETRSDTRRQEGPRPQSPCGVAALLRDSKRVAMRSLGSLVSTRLVTKLIHSGSVTQDLRAAARPRRSCPRYGGTPSSPRPRTFVASPRPPASSAG